MAAVCCGLAVLLAGGAWFLPARWRSVHPAVIQAAGRGTPQVIEVSTFAVRQNRLGPASLLLEAATEAGLRGTNELALSLAAAPISPEVRALGGPDPTVAVMIPGLSSSNRSTNNLTALEVFLPVDHRGILRRQFAESRSPGIQTLQKFLSSPPANSFPRMSPADNRWRPSC